MAHDVEYSVHKGQNSLDNNLCKSDMQVDIYLKLLLIKSNPVAFLLIQKDKLICILNLQWVKYSLLFIHHHLFFERTFILKVHQILCAIWYHLCNLKNMKNTHGRIPLLVKFQAYFTESNTPPWVLFKFLKLYKCYQIVQCITLKINYKW